MKPDTQLQQKEDKRGGMEVEDLEEPLVKFELDNPSHCGMKIIKVERIVRIFLYILGYLLFGIIWIFLGIYENIIY